MSEQDQDPDDEEELDEFGVPKWAAEEPTAMWDESLLADSGYQELVEHREQAPRAESGPATEREYGGADESAVKVSADLTGPNRAVAPAPGRGGLSWALTLGIAAGLGLLVYLLVRLLR